MNSAVALIGPGGRLYLDRRTIEALAEVFVGLLDITEPEADCETTALEDDFVVHRDGGAGDPEDAEDDDPGGGNVEDEPQEDR